MPVHANIQTSYSLNSQGIKTQYRNRKAEIVCGSELIEYWHEVNEEEELGYGSHVFYEKEKLFDAKLISNVYKEDKEEELEKEEDIEKEEEEEEEESSSSSEFGEGSL